MLKFLHLDGLKLFCVAAALSGAMCCGGIAAVPIGATEEGAQAAEGRVVEEIRRMYGEARLKLERRDYPGAQAGFFDCLALCQAAAGHLSDPRSIEGVRLGCVEKLDALKTAERRQEVLGGWKKRLAALEMPEFRVREAELGPVLELLRRKIGVLAGGEPPNLTLQFTPALRQRKVTLEVQRMPAGEVLETLARMAGLEVRYQQFAILLTEAPVVKP